MKIRTLSLEKKTGTYADAIAAFGLAHLMYLLGGEHPRIDDEGWCYKLSWPSGERESTSLNYRAAHDDPGYSYVILKEGDPDAPPSGRRIDYAKERERYQAWRRMRDDLRKARGGRLSEEDQEQLNQAAPMANWLLYQNLNVLQAFGSYNGLHAAIRRSSPDAFAVALEGKLLDLAGQGHPRASTEFAPKASAVQAFNPTAGKGINRPKPDGPALSALPTAYVDWFEEWLRFIGVGRAGRAVNLGDDIKLITLAPAELTDVAASLAHDALVQERAAWTSAKIDLLCSLGLARTLVEHSGLLQIEDAEVAEFFADESVTPRDVVAGLHTAYFTSLGSARALTNVGFVGLPGWFPVTRESASVWLDIIAEHQDVLRVLDEERSEEGALLLLYRDFLAGGGAAGDDSLLEFLGAYAVHVLRTRARNRFVRQFSVSNLRRLIGFMGETYAAILDNEGFRAVAAAMRRATVTEQFLKSRPGGKQEHEIHYGLFADIKRKAQFRDQLVAALGEFVSDYNTENARYVERARSAGREPVRPRPQVTTRQLEEFVRLLDAHKPERVAMLLLAYASAREAREHASGGSSQDEDVAPVGQDAQGGEGE